MHGSTHGQRCIQCNRHIQQPADLHKMKVHLNRNLKVLRLLRLKRQDEEQSKEKYKNEMEFKSKTLSVWKFSATYHTLMDQ